MSITTNERSRFYSAILLCLLAATGCAKVSGTENAALYEGDEEATQLHMREVEDEERSHMQQIAQQAPQQSVTQAPQRGPEGGD